MPYMLYGKHLAEYKGDDGKWHEPDKRFAPLNEYGVRVSRLTSGFAFASREDAEDYLKKHADPNRKDVAFEIRKVK